MTRHWATYADSAYLPRLKALYASMQRHCGDFVLHVLGWDGRVTSDLLMGELNVSCRHIGGFLERHPDLKIESLPGPPRTRVEHMWTCGPQWIADVMEKT